MFNLFPKNKKNILLPRRLVIDYFIRVISEIRG